MSFILPKQPKEQDIKPFVVVCEGMGDATFIERLLKSLNIGNCCVGCPNPEFTKGQGEGKIPAYLQGIQAITKERNILSGIAVVADTNHSSFRARFTAIAKGFVDAQFPKPKSAYSILDVQGQQRVGVYLIPRKGQKGTLEDLLLEAVFNERPVLEQCVENFSACAKAKKWKRNQWAKMRLSAIAAISCKSNPWASCNTMWSDKGCPVPISSPCFKEVKDFLAEFTK